MKNRFELAKDVFIDFVDLDDYIEIYNKGGSVMVKLIEMILKENLVTKKAIAKLIKSRPHKKISFANLLADGTLDLETIKIFLIKKILRLK